MTRFSAADIRRYYDRHTAAFITLGEGGNVGAIHRAVWAPGVGSRDGAFRYVENQIAERIRRLQLARAHIVDLGCGIGASLSYLAEQLPTITGTGITLSPVQARLAEERIRRGGLSDRIACIEGDYCHVPARVRTADVAYAIESFAHGPDARRFLEQCRALLRPNGLLVICDDFLRPADDRRGAAHAIEQFRNGWHINTLLEASELQALAREAGFEHESTTDLSQYLDLNRPRDRAARVFARLLEWLPIHWSRFDYLAGGSALQRCLQRGWIGYELAVFRRM